MAGVSQLTEYNLVMSLIMIFLLQLGYFRLKVKQSVDYKFQRNSIETFYEVFSMVMTLLTAIMIHAGSLATCYIQLSVQGVSTL
jgi:hypothetical protein